MPALLDPTNVRVLRTDEEYDAAHAELLTLLDAGVDEGHPAYDRFELLTALIAAYDREHVRMHEVPVSPQDAVLFMLDQRGLSRADLEELMGGKSRVSEFFAGKRPLSMAQLQNLRAAFAIPAELLLPPAPEGVVRIPGVLKADGEHKSRVTKVLDVKVRQSGTKVAARGRSGSFKGTAIVGRVVTKKRSGTTAKKGSRGRGSSTRG